MLRRFENYVNGVERAVKPNFSSANLIGEAIGRLRSKMN
jgi:hypothetical protein